MPSELNSAITNVYTKAGFIVTTQPKRENDPEGIEYGACRFSLNGKNIAYRVGKKTQDRPGNFVTMWKRSEITGEIVPFDGDDEIDFLVVDVSDVTRAGKCYRGQFIFDKKTLIDKGLMLSSKGRGKLATRVFPPWSEALALEGIARSEQLSLAIKKTQKLSSSAKATQKWQLHYFVPFEEGSHFDIDLLLERFNITSTRD